MNNAIEKLNKFLTAFQIDDKTPMQEKAKQIAVQAHLRQKRWNGDSYVTHPIRVAAAAPAGSPNLKTVAYLHDVVEDSDIIFENLKEWGFPEEIIDAVESVTKRQGETYLDFILRAKANTLGRAVKILDIQDNLRDLTNRHKTMRDKYLMAVWILEQS